MFFLPSPLTPSLLDSIYYFKLIILFHIPSNLRFQIKYIKHYQSVNKYLLSYYKVPNPVLSPEGPRVKVIAAASVPVCSDAIQRGEGTVQTRDNSLRAPSGRAIYPNIVTWPLFNH